jgi:hypothetical protein
MYSHWQCSEEKFVEEEDDALVDRHFAGGTLFGLKLVVWIQDQHLYHRDEAVMGSFVA